VANHIDQNGNLCYTRYGEWEVAAAKRGLDGPYKATPDRIEFRHQGEVRATWTWTPEGGSGVIYK
jgi:hypothetical protein